MNPQIGIGRENLYGCASSYLVLSSLYIIYMLYFHVLESAQKILRTGLMLVLDIWKFHLFGPIYQYGLTLVVIEVICLYV